MEHYLHQAQLYRSTLPEPDVTLELLRQAVFAFFGVKEPLKGADLEDQVRRVVDSQDGQPSSMARARLTKEEADAYIAAGMPSPFTGWLERYRNERR